MTSSNNAEINREIVKELPKEQRKELNADPITGEPGAHPVGAGLGAVTGGAATGIVAGALGGPVGAIVGGVVGAVVGGLAGKGLAETVNPTEEDVYWRGVVKTTPYYAETLVIYSDLDYDHDYEEAYRLGYSKRHNYSPETRFEDVENELQREWEITEKKSRLSWNEAKHAVKDAWERVTYSILK